jgi:FHA domain-containing protein
MIMIRVVSFNGEPPARPVVAEFDELGGTIGRSDGSQLVLPDPERHVSRLQARIVWRNGRFEILNVGANPLEAGTQAVPNGGAAAIGPGDRLVIGGYVLEVGGEVRAAAGAERAAPVDDPLGLFGADPAQTGERSGKTAHTPPETTPPARAGALIPDDFDPFADPFAPRPAQMPPPAPTALDDPGFGAGSESVSGPGIATMFGLGPAAPAAGRDPLAGSALAAPPPGEEEDGQAVDPLAALSGVRPQAAGPAPMPDQVPEVQGAYRPPVAVLPDDAFLSWEQAGEGEGEGGEGDEGADRSGAMPRRAEDASPALRPRVDIAVSPGASPGPLAERAASAAVTPAREPPVPAPAPVDERAGPVSADAEALLRAFLKGLGTPDLALPHGLTPATMEGVGRLLREATEGTLALLLARALTKREVRAEVTMIVSRDNNPLKFSPDVEVALAHLLAPRGKGFLPPVEAMRDAYDDLRSHELGFMAGMRAALAGVLHRFDPAVLEQRLSARSMLDNLLPMNRRARLWDLYTELYREIASEAEDDFHALFGREFLRAYEEQVERLKERDA